MLLTTNRMNNIDPAFESRIDITLAYDDLNQTDRAKIWRNLINSFPPAEVNITEEVISSLAEFELNGRQINSAVKTGKIIALREGVPLNMRHLKIVLSLREKAKMFLSNNK
jgi:SpoVK/Ycf46/Vps4 family AAA+-type ATPase